MKTILAASLILALACPALADYPYSGGHFTGPITSQIQISPGALTWGGQGVGNGTLWQTETLTGTVTDVGTVYPNSWITSETLTGSNHNAFTIQYTGAQSTAAMTIDQTTGLLTIEAPVGTVVGQFDMQNVDTTLALLAADINGTAAICPTTCVTLIAPGAYDPTVLNSVFNQDILSTPYTATYTNNAIEGHEFQWRLGAGWSGGRIATDTTLVSTGLPAGGNNNLVGSYSRAIWNSNTNGTSNNPNGSAAGLIAVASMSSSLTGWLRGFEAMELDIITRSTGNIERLYGFTVSKYAADGTGAIGRTADTAIHIAANACCSVGWGSGLGTTSIDYWPFNQANGRLVWTPANSWGNLTRGPNSGKPRNGLLDGVNIEEAVISGCAFKSNGICIDGGGAQVVGQGRLAGDSSGNVALTAPGTVALTAAVHSGGSGYTAGGLALMYPVAGGVDGIFTVGVTAGAVVSVNMQRAPVWPGAPDCTSNCALVGRDFRAGTGATVDFTTQAGGDVQLGSTSALATGATAGFARIPTAAGTPTGTTSSAGGAPILADTTHHRLYWNEGNSGTWYDVPANPKAPFSCAFGAITSATSVPTCFYKVPDAATVVNITASTLSLTGTNVVMALLECGTSTTCASPTTMGSVSITAAGTAFVATVSSAAIAAGDYIAVEATGGTFSAANPVLTASIKSN